LEDVSVVGVFAWDAPPVSCAMVRSSDPNVNRLPKVRRVFDDLMIVAKWLRFDRMASFPATAPRL
jgi:hypothetical protein